MLLMAENNRAGILGCEGDVSAADLFCECSRRQQQTEQTDKQDHNAFHVFPLPREFLQLAPL
jgi:hypothetical protein